MAWLFLFEPGAPTSSPVPTTWGHTAERTPPRPPKPLGARAELHPLSQEGSLQPGGPASPWGKEGTPLVPRQGLTGDALRTRSYLSPQTCPFFEGICAPQGKGRCWEPTEEAGPGNALLSRDRATEGLEKLSHVPQGCRSCAARSLRGNSPGPAPDSRLSPLRASACPPPACPADSLAVRDALCVCTAQDRAASHTGDGVFNVT